jgi:A/G-specific adenine glycosylase
VRLLSRLLAYPGDPRSTEGQRLLWAMAEILLPQRGAGRLNQALMELGSGVCAPRAPRCDECPAAPMCRANQQGLQQEIPRPKTKPPAEAVCEAAVLVRRGGRVLLLRWPEGRRWAGLWDFPRFPLERHSADAPSDDGLGRELVNNVLALTGVRITPGPHITTITHGVTRFRITLECFTADYRSCDKKTATALETRWLRASELQDYPLSSTGRKLANLIQEPLPRTTSRRGR